MKDFIRQPTKKERALAVVLNAAFCILFGWLVAFLALRNMWVAASLSGALLIVVLALLIRAAFGARQALNRKQAHALAWALVVLGAGGVAIAVAVNAPSAQRLIVLAGSITVLTTGLAGVRGRGDDA